MGQCLDNPQRPTRAPTSLSAAVRHAAGQGPAQASLVVLMHRTIPEQLAHSHVLRGAVSLQTLRKPLPPSNRLRDMYRGRGKPP